MSTKKDFIPAFPSGPHKADSHGQTVEYRDLGMSLRDYFAAKAMQGLLAEPNHEKFGSTVEALTPDHKPTGVPGTRVSVAAYVIADAMLKAREQ